MVRRTPPAVTVEVTGGVGLHPGGRRCVGRIGSLSEGELAAYQQAGESPMVIAIRPEPPFRPRLDELHQIRSTEVRGPVDEMTWLTFGHAGRAERARTS